MKKEVLKKLDILITKYAESKMKSKTPQTFKLAEDVLSDLNKLHDEIKEYKEKESK